jgi:hypothetical protein
MISLLAAEAPIQMGKIIGGWEYIWAAYILSWTGLVLYTASLVLRRRKS